MLATIKLYSRDESAKAVAEGGIAYSAVADISAFYLEKKVIGSIVEPSKMFTK
ncbi:MAG: hypothetical protein WCD89_09485 [Anaerocolumna sp.]